MKKLLALSLSIMLFGMGAEAQVITPAGGDALANARHLIDIMGVEKTVTEHLNDEQNIESSGQFVVDKIALANPGQEDKIKVVLVKVDRAIIPQVVPPYIDFITHLYAADYTPQELDQLAAFYQTSAGQKLLLGLAGSMGESAFTTDELDQLKSFKQTPLGQKFHDKAPDIVQKMSLYATDVMRVKQRELVYAGLIEELPKNDLKVPNPFIPDTSMDKALHERALKSAAPVVSSKAGGTQ